MVQGGDHHLKQVDTINGMRNTFRVSMRKSRIKMLLSWNQYLQSLNEKFRIKMLLLLNHRLPWTRAIWRTWCPAGEGPSDADNKDWRKVHRYRISWHRTRYHCNSIIWFHSGVWHRHPKPLLCQKWNYYRTHCCVIDSASGAHGAMRSVPIVLTHFDLSSSLVLHHECRWAVCRCHTTQPQLSTDICHFLLWHPRNMVRIWI